MQMESAPKHVKPLFLEVESGGCGDILLKVVLQLHRVNVHPLSVTKMVSICNVRLTKLVVHQLITMYMYEMHSELRIYAQSSSGGQLTHWS